MNNFKKIQTQRLQENLRAIRQIAGWTAAELGDQIGVSKQTISNLENNKNPMTLTQYIAIRAVLDYEIERNPENKLLPQVIHLLLDQPETAEEQTYRKAQSAVSDLAAAKAAKVSPAALSAMLTGLTAAVGLAPLAGIVPLAGIAAGAVSGGMLGWMKHLQKKDK